MIEQWSFVPFDSGASLSGQLDRINLPAEWVPLKETEISKNRVGQGVRGWIIPETAPTDGSRYLYLNEQGFGIYVARTNLWPNAQMEPGIVVDILDVRRKLHIEAISGEGELALQIKVIARYIQEVYSLRRSRPDIFKGVPYVLSIYLSDLISEKQIRKTQALLALIEPSLIDSSDDPEANLSRTHTDRIALIRKLQPETYPDLINDYDRSEDAHAYMSWAGVVVLFDSTSPAAPHVRRTYRELEVRTQLAWSMSYFARKWCEASQRERRLPDRVAEELRYRIAPIVRRAVELSDASVGTRMRMILQGLDTSSGLSAQILAAKAGLEDLESYVEFLREKQRIRYNRFVEAALFILACIQAVPIFFQTPLINTPHRFLGLSILVAFAALAILAIIRRRLDREVFTMPSPGFDSRI